MEAACCWLADCVARETGFQLQFWLIALAEHFEKSLTNGTILASTSESQPGCWGPVLSSRLAKGSACSVPTQIYLLSFLLQNSLYRSCRIPPGSPCCRFPCQALQLGGAGKRACRHRPRSLRQRHPQGRAWHAAGAKPGCLKPFSPASSFLCNGLSSSVSENRNEGKFLI